MARLLTIFMVLMLVGCYNVADKPLIEDIARARNLDMDELLTEIEAIVNSGTRLDIQYYLNTIMDEDKVEDIYLYFKEDAETDSLDDAVDELGAEYSEEEIRLVRIKFISEVAN